MGFGILALIAPGAVQAQSSEDFFAGKQLLINVGSAAGGGYDAQARLMSRHLGDHIPGNPSVIVQNRPGAGGLVAANYVYNLAPKDGTVMGLLQRTAITAKPLIGDNVNFEVSNFNWLGSLASEPGVLMVWHTSPVTTAQDLMIKPLIVGGAGIADDSELTPKVINAVIGTKLKVITGYQSVTAVMLAMERGEVDGLADWSWSNAKRNPRYLRDKLARVVMQFGLHRSDELKDVPMPFDFAKSEADKTLLSLYFAPKAVSRPVALPPGVPADRVAVIRKAFIDMTKDSAFLADAEKMGIPVNPAGDAAIHDVISVVQQAPTEVVDRLRSIISER
jgi:tripartite-type tricarboxylate transporter receptor subunit TctC